MLAWCPNSYRIKHSWPTNTACASNSQANKAFEKFEKQIKAAKSSGGKDSKTKQEQVGAVCVPGGKYQQLLVLGMKE